MKYSSWDIGGDIVKTNSTYTVKDNTELKNLVVSSTMLSANKSTTGHRHKGQEEVYMFVDGTGKIRWQDVSYEPFMHASWLLEESERLLATDAVIESLVATK